MFCFLLGKDSYLPLRVWESKEMSVWTEPLTGGFERGRGQAVSENSPDLGKETDGQAWEPCLYGM